MSIEIGARVDTRALGGAVLAATGLSLALTAAYLAGGAARTAANTMPAAHVATAASQAKTAFQRDAGAARSVLEPTPVALRESSPEPAAAAIRAARIPGAVDCLTDAVYYEARGESASGQAAVAQVVLNRVRRAGFPKSVCGVVFQGVADQSCQFSFACDGAMRLAREPAAWRRAHAVAQRALDGSVMQEVGDATNFHVARLGQIWGSGLVKVAQVGAHVFYKLTGHGTFVAHGTVRAITPSDDMIAVPADTGDQPNLILASAVTIRPMGQGGPVGPISEPASASAAEATPSAKTATSAAKGAATMAGPESTAPKANG